MKCYVQAVQGGEVVLPRTMRFNEKRVCSITGLLLYNISVMGQTPLSQ